MANKESGLENEDKGLCDRCKSIPPTTFFNSGKQMIGSKSEFRPIESYQLIEGSDAFEELKLSAAAGCGLCKLFQDALEINADHPDKQLRKHPRLCKHGIRIQRKNFDKLPNNLIPDSFWIAFGTSSHPLDVRLMVLTDQSETRSIEPAFYVTETESDSPTNFALARSWLAECYKNHVDCRDPLEFELPRRLLDVATPSKPGIIRLVLALDLLTKETVDYAALSHCWGSFWPLQTKKDNLRSHINEIPESQLPQTFHDAVRTTRELGLRYLWIDSLCIVHDEPADFEAECARMNTIFANALCTISASDGRDCRDGLFRSRTMKPIRLTYESDGFEPRLTVIMQPAFPRSWMQGLQGPLQSRAWVLQERHLSPRVIHYTKKCLMWECRTAIASEYIQKMRLTKADPNRSVWPDLSSERFLDGGRSKLGSENTRSCLRDDQFRTLHDRWYRIVEDYSNRVLSHPEDRLPALSGFAAEWKRMKPRDEYFAGLWKSDIVKGLTWFPRSAHQVKIPRPGESSATWPPSSPFKGTPSWSWAAFDGPVAYFGEDWYNKSFNYELSVFGVGQQLPPPAPWSLHFHNVTTTVEQLNPFGRVSNGEITVSGWSIVITLSESAFSTGGVTPKVYRLHPDLKSVLDGMVYFDHDPFHLPMTQVQLVQLGMRATIQGMAPSVCGLALLQLRTEEWTSNKDFYRRVGMFELNDHSFWLPRREWKAVTIV